MLKLKSIVSFLLLVILLPYSRNTSTSAISPLFIARDYRSDNLNTILVKIDEITFLGETGDTTGDGEFRLLMIGSDGNGHSSGIFCPAEKPISVRKGMTLKRPCLSAFNFDENEVADSVYLMVMALDEDKSTAVTDIPYEMAVGGLSKALGDAIVKLNLVTNPTPYLFTMEVLLSYTAGEIKSWIEQADVIGSHSIYLSRKNNWSATGRPKTLKSSDGGIEFTYTVIRSMSVPQGSATKTPRPSSSNTTKTPVIISTIGTDSAAKTGAISCAQNIYFARLRKTPGYKSKVEVEDTVAEIPCGETIKILDGPTSKDNLNWWYVSWNGQTGWLADHTSTGKVLIIFHK